MNTFYTGQSTILQNAIEMDILKVSNASSKTAEASRKNSSNF